jgi:hypothetical protein
MQQTSPRSIVLLPSTPVSKIEYSTTEIQLSRYLLLQKLLRVRLSAHLVKPDILLPDLLLRITHVLLHTLSDSSVAAAENPRSQESSVGAVVDTDSRHRHALGHVANTQQAVHTIADSGFHGNTDDGERSVRGYHAGEVSGAAGCGDNGLDAILCGCGGVLCHPGGSAVGGCDADGVRDCEFVKESEPMTTATRGCSLISRAGVSEDLALPWSMKSTRGWMVFSASAMVGAVMVT